MGLVGAAAAVIQVTSLGHAVFHLAMISEFGSLDEMACWIETMGSLQSLPAQLLMGGIWMTVLFFILFFFAIFPFVKAVIIAGVCFSIFGLGHIAIARVLQAYYVAVYKVSKGLLI